MTTAVSNSIEGFGLAAVELPEGWALARAGEQLNLTNGFPFKPSQWKASGLPIIRIQNLNNQDAPFNFCPDHIPERYRIRNGDLLFAWSGTPGTSFGAHIWLGGDAWLNQHIFRVTFDSELFDKQFLRLAINHNLDEYISQAQGGVGLAHITKRKFDASFLALSPLPEQRRIVAKIKQLLAHINSARKRLARVAVILKHFRQAVLAAACSGRLTADWREEVSPTQLTPPEPANSDGICEVEETFEAAEPWRWLPLQSLCDPDRPICYGVIKLGVDVPSGIPCLRTSDVKPLLIDISGVKRIAPNISNEYRRSLLHGGEILVNVRGTLGGVAAVPDSLQGWNISREVAVVPVSGVIPKFVAFWIASVPCQNWLTGVSKGVTYTGINIEDLRLLPVALPSQPEQEEIVRRVDTLFKVADVIERRVTAATAHTEKLTQAILAKAFRGELVPTEAELARREGRSYEPASALLARIHADRSVKAKDQTRQMNGKRQSRKLVKARSVSNQSER